MSSIRTTLPCMNRKGRRLQQQRQCRSRQNFLQLVESSSSTSSSSSWWWIICIIFVSSKLSVSLSCYAFSNLSSSLTSLRRPPPPQPPPSKSSWLGMDDANCSMKTSLYFHPLIPSSLVSKSLFSLNRQQSLVQHNMSAVVDSSSSLSSTTSMNRFQRGMDKIVRKFGNKYNHKHKHSDNDNDTNSEKYRIHDVDNGHEIIDEAHLHYGDYRTRRILKNHGSSFIDSNNNNNNMKTVHTLQQYKQQLDEFRGIDGKTVVVRFFATWCKACKVIQPSYHRLATLYPNIIFLEVPITNENANLHQGLAVPSLPYVHIYHPMSGLVEEVKISRKYFNHFVRMVKCYDDGSCPLEDYVVHPLPSYQDEDGK